MAKLVVYTVRDKVKSFTRLKAHKYREMRSIYPQLPSHYVYTVCQDASTRAKGFLRLRKLGLAEKEYQEVRRVTIWFDDHLWKPYGLTSIRIATHKGWITIEFNPHKQYWKYINRGWRLVSEAKIKLDKKNRQLIIYLSFAKEVEEYKPRGYLPIDVNENNVTMLVDGVAYLFETHMRKLILGYYYRRKRIQKRYDRLYGVKSRIKRKVMRKFKERAKKQDVRWKIANIIVRTAYERHYAIVLEKLGRKPAQNMIKRIRDRQLRHMLFQVSFRGIQRAIEEKAREYGVQIIYVNPRDTSKRCPIHSAPITYSNGLRIGRCSKGGELWHRDIVACWNLLLKAYLGDGSNAPSLGRLISVDGRAVPLPSTATHDPIEIPKSLWARWNSLGAIMNLYKMIGMIT